MLLFLCIKIRHSTLKLPGLSNPIGSCSSVPSGSKETNQSFLDALTKECQGLRNNLHTIGCDGKNPLINAGCATFATAVMLLYSNHAKQNIKERLKDLVGDIELRKTKYISIVEN